MSKRMKGFVACGLMACLLVLTGVFAVYKVSKPQAVFATELKLQTFESLDGMSLGALTTAEGVRKNLMPVIRGSLRAMDHTLTEDEESTLIAEIVKRLRAESDVGNIEFDVDGNLTDLSKSYVSNAVSDAVAYALPLLDMQTTISRSDYTQILDMQNSMDALKKSNEELKSMINTINQTMSVQTSSGSSNSNKSSNDGGTKQTEIVSSSYSDKMDALYTELLARIVYNRKTGDKLTKDTADIYDIISNLNYSQQDALNQVSDAMGQIKSLTSTVQNVQNTSTTNSSSVESLQQQITQVQDNINTSITDVTNEITNTSEASTTQFTNRIETLQFSVNNSFESMQNQLNSDMNNLKSSMDSADSKTASDLQNVQNTLNTKMDSVKSDLTSRIDKETAKLTNNLASTKSELQTSLDLKYAELQGQDAELKRKLESDKQELDKTILKLKEDLNTDIQTKYDELTDTINTNLIEMQTKDKELVDALEETRKNLVDSLNDTKIELTNQINTVDADLQQTKASLEGTQEALTAVTDRVTVNEQNITDICTQIQTIVQNYDAEIANLWSRIDSNTTELANLKSRMEQFMLSADQHYKVDMVPGFTIAAGDWAVNGVDATYVIKHKFVKDCYLAEVNYGQQYDITPGYGVDEVAGTVTITIPATQVQNIIVESVVCYHIVSDDVGRSAGEITDPGNVNIGN